MIVSRFVDPDPAATARAMAFPDYVAQAVKAARDAEGALLEGLVTEAMALQDFDQLELLCVVHRDGVPPTVASTLA